MEVVDRNVIAYQGKGVYANRSLSNLNHTMSHQFGYEEIKVDSDTFNMSTLEKHKFYKYQPQLVTIWLGTNDSAAPVDQDTFKTAYAKLLGNVRAQYPNATILNMALKESMYLDTIKAVATGSDWGEANKCYMLELNKFTSTSFGHPDVAEDQRIANQIIEKLDSIKGLWDVPLVGSGDETVLSMRADYNTGGVLTEVELADASKDSQAYGDEVVLNSTVSGTTDCIRVFYMNKNTLAPLFASYTIE